MEHSEVKLVGTGLPIGADFQSTRLALTQLIASAQSSVAILTPYLDRSGAEFLAPLLQGLIERHVECLLMLRSGIRADDHNVPGLRHLARLVGPDKLDQYVELIQIVERAEGGEEHGIHAKTVIVDGTRAYVGSSNFTRNGLERNVELGTLLSGPVVQFAKGPLEWLRKVPEARHISWRAVAAKG